MHSWYCATITTAWLLHFIPQIKPYIQRMQLPIPPLPDSDNHNPLCFCFFFFYSFIYLFYFTILYWFYHTLTWILHGCTCVPHPEPHSHLPPHPIPPGHLSAPALSTLSHALNLDWWSISHMIIHMVSVLFSHIIPPLPSPTESKSLFFTSVSLLLSCI